MTRFRYFGVFECPPFTCHTDVNLVNREANLCFLKLVFFRTKPILDYCVFLGKFVMQDYSMRFTKFKKDMRVLYYMLPFQARTLPLFLEFGWLPINQICIISVQKNPGWTCTRLPL